jgi:hypothetical protein
MTDANDFKTQVLRAFAALYRAHPRVITLSSEQTNYPPPNRNDISYTDELLSSGGTITWLYRNGFVNGEFQETNPGSFMTNAQLSGKGYAIFRKVYPNVGRPLGEAAVEAVDKHGERELSVLADLLMDKLA